MQKVLSQIFLVAVAFGIMSCQPATTPSSNTTINNNYGTTTKEFEDFINSHAGTIVNLSVYIGASQVFATNPVSGLVAKLGTLEFTDSLSVKTMLNLATVSEIAIPSPYDRLYLYYY